MDTDPRPVVAITEQGGFWYHPECAPAADPEDLQEVQQGTGYNNYTYICEECDQEIKGVRPADEKEKTMSETKTYEATAVRDGQWWAVTVHGLPAGAVPHTQGSNWENATKMAADLVRSVTGEKDVSVWLLPENQVEAQLLRLIYAAEDELARLRSKMAVTMETHGKSQRDIAQVLGMSEDVVTTVFAAREAMSGGKK